jgi:hypothetical protein
LARCQIFHAAKKQQRLPEEPEPKKQRRPNQESSKSNSPSHLVRRPWHLPCSRAPGGENAREQRVLLLSPEKSAILAFRRTSVLNLKMFPVAGVPTGEGPGEEDEEHAAAEDATQRACRGRRARRGGACSRATRRAAQIRTRSRGRRRARTRRRRRARGRGRRVRGWIRCSWG